MADIFVSYARADTAFVERLVEALGTEYEVFWDSHIRPGAAYRKVIQSELERAKCVVVVWSKTSIESDWVIDEAEEAKSRGVLIPVTIQDVKPPAGFRQRQVLALANWSGSKSDGRFMSLVSAINELVGQSGSSRSDRDDGHKTIVSSHVSHSSQASASSKRKVAVAIYPNHPSFSLLAMNFKARVTEPDWLSGDRAGLDPRAEVQMMDDALFDASQYDLVICVTGSGRSTPGRSPGRIVVQYLQPELDSEVIVREFKPSLWGPFESDDAKPVSTSEAAAMIKRKIAALLSETASA